MLRLMLMLPGSEGLAHWEARGWEGGPSCTRAPSALPGRTFAGAMTPQEEEEFRRLAALPNIYELISKSIAPSIFGGTDMKKAIACLLFGGSRKRWGSKPSQVQGEDG